VHVHLEASASACLRLRPVVSSRASELSDGAFVAAAVGVAFAAAVTAVAVTAAVVSVAGAEAAGADDDDDDDDEDDDDNAVPNPVAAAAAAAAVVETAVVVEGRVPWPRGIVSVKAAIGAHDFKHLPMASIVPWHRA
jgi:hypothetical protein